MSGAQYFFAIAYAIAASGILLSVIPLNWKWLIAFNKRWDAQKCDVNGAKAQKITTLLLGIPLILGTLAAYGLHILHWSWST
ncbi:MAG TPA: hypothetical protein VFT87_00500, partial [Candidatus Saccharimonadales bacterium]|nr:hypothetical protein [Candidatus Saccharimonadales bacterium]